MKRDFGLIALLSNAAIAQSTTLEKVDPPSWWTGMTINPVRVVLRGTILKNASVETSKSSGLTAGNLKWGSIVSGSGSSDEHCDEAVCR